VRTQAKVLPANLQAQSVVAQGVIVSIPRYQNNIATFVFKLFSLRVQQKIYPLDFKVKLAWRGAKSIKVGDKWQLTVKLKHPRGFWDEGVFAYQKWLFAQGIRATGYVQTNNNRLLGVDGGYGIDRFRTQLASAIATTLANESLSGLISALAVGVRDTITDEQWDVLRGTGTNHLFAIAGLHIGLVSGIVYFIVHFLWRRSALLPLYLPAPKAGAIAALLAALLYSALAGFSLPTQRASIMLALFFVAKLCNKTLPAWRAWFLALVFVIGLEPLQVLSESFWLSFAAVALIIYGVNGRVVRKGLWWHWGRTQWVLSWGLLPFGFLFFQQATLASFIANTIAIPWVSFVVLPLTLIGVVFWLLVPAVGSFCWWLAAQALAFIWPLLQTLAAWKCFAWNSYLAIDIKLLAALFAVTLLLAPRGIPGRLLGLIGFLPALLITPKMPMQGEAWITVLDVGQGLAIVVQTKQHTLLYDAGPYFNKHFDAGSAVVAPFLLQAGVHKIDLFMISDNINAYSGGGDSVLSSLPISQILTNVAWLFRPGLASACDSSDKWVWDGVTFQVLYPVIESNNNGSCVLRISTASQSILLSGNLAAVDEKKLVQIYGNHLATAILIAPSFGSATSSSSIFISAVHPQYVVFSTGYRNRYELPNLAILTRYQAQGVRVYTTAAEGAIHFILKSTGKAALPNTYAVHFWDY
jgi:competence protein ComEC